MCYLFGWLPKKTKRKSLMLLLAFCEKNICFYTFWQIFSVYFLLFSLNRLWFISNSLMSTKFPIWLYHKSLVLFLTSWTYKNFIQIAVCFYLCSILHLEQSKILRREERVHISSTLKKEKYQGIISTFSPNFSLNWKKAKKKNNITSDICTFWKIFL